jgi:hypothetical protein
MAVVDTRRRLAKAVPVIGRAALLRVAKARSASVGFEAFFRPFAVGLAVVKALAANTFRAVARRSAAAFEPATFVARAALTALTLPFCDTVGFRAPLAPVSFLAAFVEAARDGDVFALELGAFAERIVGAVLAAMPATLAVFGGSPLRALARAALEADFERLFLIAGFVM